MTTEYTNAVREVNTRNWNVDFVDTNIPDHPETRISSPSGRYEVEISPGYDDGELHEDRLHFFVNVYTYRIENGSRVEESGHVFSRKKETAAAAVELAQAKLDEFDQKENA